VGAIEALKEMGDLRGPQERVLALFEDPGKGGSLRRPGP